MYYTFNEVSEQCGIVNNTKAPSILEPTELKRLSSNNRRKKYQKIVQIIKSEGCDHYKIFAEYFDHDYQRTFYEDMNEECSDFAFF